MPFSAPTLSCRHGIPLEVIGNMAGPSTQTARAVELQPANFEGLATRVTAVDDVTVTRALACQCGGRSGRLTAGSGSPDMPWLDPLIWTCGACGACRDFFDSSRDGYDGRFGHGSAYEQGGERRRIACPSCRSDGLAVSCVLFYNVDASELEEDLGPERSKHLSDYFDALGVNARCESCKTEFEIGNWELA